jgi:hypothetical protein
MATRKNVPAASVRSWFAGLSEAEQASMPTPGSRGRLHPDTIAAFHKANPRLRYETASEAEKPTIEVKGVVALDKSGRKVTKTVTLTTEQARAALGHPAGKRGRFAKGDLALALSAANADAVADQFTK